MTTIILYLELRLVPYPTLFSYGAGSLYIEWVMSAWPIHRYGRGLEQCGGEGGGGGCWWGWGWREWQYMEEK